MHIICIQMNGHKHLILVTPHPPCSFHTDFKGLLRCDVTSCKALYSVIPDYLSSQTESPLYGNHFGIGILLRAVDTANIHFAVGFVVVLGIRKRRIQIVIQISAVDGLIGIVGLVKRCF